MNRTDPDISTTPQPKTIHPIDFSAAESLATAELVDAVSSGIFRARKTAFFDSGEHVLLGDAVNLPDMDPKRPPFATKHNFSLSFGQVIALAGDFYGPAYPISDGKDDADRRARFNAGFSNLQGAATREIVLLTSKITEEITLIQDALRKNLPPSSIYTPEYVKELDRYYTSVTAFRYVNLALHNWDHFRYGAELSYRTGHAVALETAANGDLKLAYFIDGFACHYLTDLFSAGHLRTPRKEMADSADLFWIEANKCVRFMHDEDSRNGLVVQNKLGESWTAFGDARLLDLPDHENKARAVQAVQTSVNEIFAAFKNRGFSPNDSFKALDQTPDLKRLQPNSRTNPAPLFIAIEPKKIRARSSINDLLCYSWGDFGSWKAMYDWLKNNYAAKLVAPFPRSNVSPGYSGDYNIINYTTSGMGWQGIQQRGGGFGNFGTTAFRMDYNSFDSFPFAGDPGGNILHFVYSHERHCRELLYNGNKFIGDNDLSQAVNSFDVKGPPAGSAFDAEGSQLIVYRDMDDSLMSLVWLADQGWATNPLGDSVDINTIRKEPSAYQWQSDPNGSSLRVLCFTDKGLETLFRTVQTPWGRALITNDPALFSGQVRRAHAATVADTYPSQHICLRGADARLALLSQARGGWWSRLFPSYLPPVALDPHIIWDAPKLCIFFVDPRMHIFALHCPPDVQTPLDFQLLDLTAIANAPLCGSALNVLALDNGDVHVFYFGMDGHLLELFRGGSAGQWTSYDVTAYGSAPSLLIK